MQTVHTAGEAELGYFQTDIRMLRIQYSANFPLFLSFERKGNSMFNVFCQGSQKTNASISLPSTISASLNPVCFCAALKSPSSKSEPGNLWAAELPLKPRENLTACVRGFAAPYAHRAHAIWQIFCHWVYRTNYAFIPLWLLYNLGPLSHLEFSWSWNKLLNIVQYRTIVNEMCLLKWVDAQSIRGCLCCRAFFYNKNEL